jgi:hypothetical protein
MSEARDVHAEHARRAAQLDADVGAEQIASVYARALLQAAEKAAQADEVIDSFDQLMEEAIRPFPKLAEILASARISHDEKAAMLDRLFADRLPRLLLNFLKVLSRHGRLDLLTTVHRQAHVWPMRFKADEIASVIQQEIERFESHIDVREVGTVLEVGDGIARVWGLSNIMAGEMVEFPNGVRGLAFNLEENSVGVIILGRLPGDRGRRRGQGAGPVALRPGGRGSAGPGAGPAGQSAGRQRPSGDERVAARWNTWRPGWRPGSRSASRCRPGSRRSTP